MNSLELPFVLLGGLLILDELLQFSEASPEFCQEFGCKSQVLIGKRLENLFSPKDRKGKFAFYDRFSRDRTYLQLNSRDVLALYTDGIYQSRKFSW
ncbi:PAS domain-containing protein [Myxosarcina sp. GI1]|uniref:PAS domain-containing protein n=1 Tax=Myxosarcina sp. GI1 TaxID=1541065 RepID=UPI00055ACAE8|nr:PAS domain-containing protein [Myxosarcina sp. GI1]